MVIRSRLEMKMAVLENLSVHEGKRIVNLALKAKVNCNVLTSFLDLFIKSGVVSKTRGKLVGVGNRPLSNNPKECEWFYYFLTDKGFQLLKHWKTFAVEWRKIWEGSLYD